jgi:hypothetical protein
MHKTHAAMEGVCVGVVYELESYVTLGQSKHSPTQHRPEQQPGRRIATISMSCIKTNLAGRQWDVNSRNDFVAQVFCSFSIFGHSQLRGYHARN